MTRHGSEVCVSATPMVLGATPAEVIGADDQDTRLAAAQAAGVHAFVEELPEGYHTPIGVGGIGLTASQRLRLSIAGLLAADPRSVVVDSPTAGLDLAGEAAALPGLEALFRGREVSVVAASPAVRAAVARAGGAVAPPPSGPAAPVPPDDPRLPGAAGLLDPGAMAARFGELLGADCPAVRVNSTRYKPGDNLVVQYDVLTGSGWSGAVAYTRAGGKLNRKRRRDRNRTLARRAADRAPARPIAYLRDVEALVTWLPLDVRLPVLADDASRLARRLAKKGLLVDGSEPGVLRYWARRRAVLRFGPYVLKLYRDRGDYDRALRGLRAAQALAGVSTARYEGRLPAAQVTVQEWLPGCAPSMRPSASEPAGRLLAALHAGPPARVRATTSRDLYRKARSRGRFVSYLVPELRPEVTELLATLKRTAPESTPVTSHGNFHAGQLLVHPGGLAMVDVDRMCRASPAYDLACFAAHVAFGRPGDRDVLDATVDSLLTGYGSRPADLDWYLAACLLRRTAVPYRFQDEHWPAATAELVDLARMVLR